MVQAFRNKENHNISWSTMWWIGTNKRKRNGLSTRLLVLTIYNILLFRFLLASSRSKLIAVSLLLGFVEPGKLIQMQIEREREREREFFNRHYWNAENKGKIVFTALVRPCVVKYYLVYRCYTTVINFYSLISQSPRHI